MRKKYKMTGCARFFLVMLVLAPLAYLGAAYYNGQDGLQNIKDFLGIGTSDAATDDGTYDRTSEDLRDQLRDKDKEIRDLEEDLDDAKAEIRKLEREIQDLRGGQDGQ